MRKLSILLSFLLSFCNPLSYAAATQSYIAAKYGMVVSENKLASQIGLDILRSGGNAIDAAVAVGYALAVVNPCCGNIGGGGFMTIHLANGQNTFLNFREKASSHATKNMFANRKNLGPEATTIGYLAVAVPGTVLGFDTALKKYGKLSRETVMAGAIKLAEDGFLLTPYEINQFNLFTQDFRSQPNIAAIFLKNNQPYQAGDRLVQKDLADTLKQIAKNGPNYFYKGPIAQAIVKASQANGGILTLADFANYNVEELSPIQCTYQGYDVISASPPSSGGIALCEMLNILSYLSPSAFNYESVKPIHYIVEAMRYAFIDRNNRLGDPDFVKIPVHLLLSKEYAAKIARHILNARVISLKPVEYYHEYTDTTHYSIVDSAGNAVSVTYTLNGFFGARVIADNTGFFLNDEMDDFNTHPGSPNKFGLIQSVENEVEPARPLSSMTPTIIMKNGKVFLVLGSPGGPRIITSVLLTILNVIDNKMNIQQAVNEPRFHYQAEPDTIDMEPFAFSFLVQKKLELMGYRLSLQPHWGAVEAILIDPKTGALQGSHDERRPDAAALSE